MHSLLTSSSPTPLAHAMPPVAHPTLISPPHTPKTQSFGNKTPIPHGPTNIPLYLSCPVCSQCPANEELGGEMSGMRWGPLRLMGCLSLKLLLLGPGASWRPPQRREAPVLQTGKGQVTCSSAQPWAEAGGWGQREKVVYHQTK